MNVKLCETCFLSKKVVGKNFFQKSKFLPYRGIRTCKFLKNGVEIFFAFFRFESFENM